MKLLAVCLCLLLGLPASASADEASRRVKAQEIVNLLHIDKMMKQVMDGIMLQTSAMATQMAAPDMTPELKAQVQAYQRKVYALVDAQLGWKAMEPAYVDLYAKDFTDEELDAILQFYRSPAGVSMVAKLPSLTTQAQVITQQRMRSLQPQLKQLTDEFIRTSVAAAKKRSRN